MSSFARVLVGLLFVTTFPLLRAEAVLNPPSGVVIPGATRHLVVGTGNHRGYELQVSIPGSHASHPEAKYPVIYVLDGYWDFALVRSVARNEAVDGAIPDAIIVGVGYAGEDVDYMRERFLDLSPCSAELPASAGQPVTGGGGAFLEALRRDIIPFVEAHFPANSQRVLGGNSLAGLFCLFAMYSDPALFESYVALAPTVGWNHRWLFRYESELQGPNLVESARVELPVRLFVGAAGAEWPRHLGDVQAFDSILRKAAYRGFTYEFHLAEGEGHSGAKAEGWSRGLRFAFRAGARP